MRDKVKEAMRILLGQAPDEGVDFVLAELGRGTHLAHAVSLWLQTKKLSAAQPVSS